MFGLVWPALAFSACALIVALVLAILRQRDASVPRRTWNALIVTFLVIALVPIAIIGVLYAVAIALFLNWLRNAGV